MSHEEEVRLIAYQIWENEGRPQGRELDHWVKAEAIWQSWRKQGRSGSPLVPPAQSKGQKKRSAGKTQRSGSLEK